MNPSPPEEFTIPGAVAADPQELRTLVAERIGSPRAAERVVQAVASFRPPEERPVSGFRVTPHEGPLVIFGASRVLWEVTAILQDGGEVSNVEWSKAQRLARQRSETSTEEPG